MYLDVTRQVNSQLGQDFFADPAFMTQLDVAFANLYFAAAGTASTPATVPLAWRPLAQRRAAAGIEPVQFALAGMNAHINHDLPLAMVSTCTALGTAPDAGPHFADYQKIDHLLDTVEQSIRQSFENAAELAADRHLAAVANLIATWMINSARDPGPRQSLRLGSLIVGVMAAKDRQQPGQIVGVLGDGAFGADHASGT
jgi:hypothetical protein